MTKSPQTKVEHLVRLASYASVSVALLLILIKVYSWHITDSVSFLASLADSSIDLVASLLSMAAIHISLKPADDNHRFGHGKAESLAALGQSLLIAFSSLYLIIASIERIVNPQPLSETGWGMVFAALSFCFTLGLLLFQKKVVRLTNSQAIKADSVHYFSDLLANASLFVVMLLGQFNMDWVDGILGVAIAIYLLHSAWELAEESINTLLDHELPDEIRQEILAIAENQENALGIHDLKTRRSGLTYIIQMHIELDKNLPLYQAHQVAEEVEVRLLEKFPGSDILIHQDPV